MKRPIYQALLYSLLIVLLVHTKTSSQKSSEYIANFQHFTIEQGLQNRHVHCFQEDNKGFTWIGTSNGLHRFDGYDFKVFTREKDSLASNQISQLAKDKTGRLWVFHALHPNYPPRALDILDPETEKVQSFQAFFKWKAPFAVTDIFRVFPIHEHEIIIATYSGELYKYTDQFELLFELEKKDHKIQEVISGIGNTLWIKSSDNIVREINSKGHIMQEDALSAYANTLLSADKQNKLLIKNYARDKDRFYSLLAFFSTKEKPQPLNLSRFDLPINTRNFFLGPMVFDPHRQLLWCGGEGHLFAFSLEDGIAYDFFSNHPDLEDLGSLTLLHLDKNSNIWVGGSNGFLIIHLQKNRFTQYLHQEKGVFRQLHSTRAMLSDQEGNIIVNSYAGVKKVNPENGQSVPLQFHSRPKDFFLTNYLSLIRDRSGALWFGSDNGMLTYSRAGKERWIKLDSFVQEKNLAIWSMFEDISEQIWLGTNRGLYFLDANREKVQRLNHLRVPRMLKNSQILHFYEENPDQVWLCTNSGLYLWNPADHQFEVFHTGGDGPHYLPFDIISHIHQDDTGNYWLSSKGGGLIQWDREKASFKQYTTKNGLSHDVLYAVYPDEKGGLWLPSDNGLMRFEKASETVKIYFPRDGITHEEFNTVSHFQDQDGRLYFGGLNGITAFYPEEVIQHKKTHRERVEISSFSRYNAKRGEFEDKTKELLSKGQLLLPPGHKAFILKVSLLDFIKPEKHIYAYKITGLHENWVFQDRNDIRINGLPYGNHTLQLKAQGANGHWSTELLELPVLVQKPVYLQHWFICLFSFILLAIIFALIKWRMLSHKKEREALEAEVNRRTETIQRQAEELKMLDQQKSRFFANVSHELRTPLTLILGPLSRLLKQDYLKDEDTVSLLLIQKNARQLLSQVNEILELSKLESSKIKLEEKTTEFVSFIKKTVAAFDSYAGQQGLNLQLFYQGEEPDFILLDQSKVEKILHNLLSNAVKFTPSGGSVEVRVYNWNKSIQIQVKDSGQGIHPKDLPRVFDRYFQSTQTEEPVQGGTGIGLALSRELASLMKGNLKAESKLGKGSVFTLEFPKKTTAPEFPVTIDTTDQASSAATDSDEGAIPHETASRTSTSTIMVVEDNAEMRNYIKSVLATRYKVVLAENGQEALKHLAESSPGGRGNNVVPDLILSDVMMPVMDGFSFMKKVKSTDQWRSIPMVMLTAKGEQRHKLHALRIGVDDYLLKPFDEEELLVRIHNLLNNYENRKKWSVQEHMENSRKKTEEISVKKPVSPKVSQPIISLEDQEWLKQLEQVSNQFIGDHNFGIERLSEEMAMSQRQLFRKVRQLTGMTPKKYIQELRFQRARQWLESRTYSSVKAVSFAIGMKDVKYFSQKFRARFGKSPSSYL